MTKRPTKQSRLPKAPLAEVIFELRWAIQGDEAHAVFQTDPGFPQLLDKFTKIIKPAGYSFYKDMNQPALQTPGYGVARRYYPGADSPFPIMQIGPGIFATNESSLYEWNSFRGQIKKGLKALLDAYPKIGYAPLSPNRIEIRYVDVFNKTLFGKAKLFHFVKNGTNLDFKLPPMLDDRTLFSGEPAGRFVFQRSIKGRKDTMFTLDLGSGQNKESGEEIVQMVTKIQSTGAALPKLRDKNKFINEIDDWLENAHNITSPFFKNFILPTVMQKFQ